MRGFLSRREGAILLSCLVLFVFHIGPYPGVNENRYLDLIRSITEEGRFAIDRFHYNTVDKSYRDGHYYAGAAPGIAFLGIPPYLALKALWSISPLSLFSQYDTARYIREEMGNADAPDDFVIRYPISEFFLAHLVVTAFLCCTCGALSILLLYRLLGEFAIQETQRLWILAFCAFGSITFFYTVRLLAHVPSTFCLLSGFYLLTSVDRHRLTHGYLFLAGFALGMSLLFEYTVLPVVMVLGLYGLKVSKRYTGLLIAGGSVPVSVLMVYHFISFGSPFTTAYAFPMSPENLGPHGVLVGTGVGGFGLPTIQSLWGLSLSGYRGLFVYMPVLLFAVYALIRCLRDKQDPWRKEWCVIAAIVLLQFIFNAMMVKFWSGGYIWGPRYLIPMIPFLMLALAPAFRFVRPGWLLSTGVLSILINWTAVQYIVPQQAFGGVKAFLLFGPTTQFYQFASNYFSTYSVETAPLSSIGGWLIMALLLAGIWMYIDRRPDTKEFNTGRLR